MGMTKKARKEYTLRPFCRFCGTDKNLTIDHKHPIILGGTNDRNNLQTLCKECNQLKSAIPNDVFKRIMQHGVYCFLSKHKKHQRI